MAYAHRNTRDTEKHKVPPFTHMTPIMAGCPVPPFRPHNIVLRLHGNGISKSILRFLAATPSPLPVMARSTHRNDGNCPQSPPQERRGLERLFSLSTSFSFLLGSSSLHHPTLVAGKDYTKTRLKLFLLGRSGLLRARCSDLYCVVTGKYFYLCPWTVRVVLPRC